MALYHILEPLGIVGWLKYKYWKVKPDQLERRLPPWYIIAIEFIGDGRQVVIMRGIGLTRLGTQRTCWVDLGNQLLRDFPLVQNQRC
jgi:hypothetical protein